MSKETRDEEMRNTLDLTGLALETLSVFAFEHDLVITNTFYELLDGRLYTWTFPRDDGEDHTIRNQIDYILINRRYRHRFTRVKINPGADIKSDHNNLVGEYRTKNHA